MNVLNALLKPAAIQRKYESLRRHWKIEEEKENCEEFLKLTSNKKKYRQRRQTSCCTLFLPETCSLLQKYQNRQECVLKSEEKYWKAVTLDHMSEESDDAKDPNAIVVHHLPWRSKGYT